MWKAYIVYRCEKCGFKRMSRRPIYKYDEDDYHFRAFGHSPDQILALIEVQGSQCPHCSGYMKFHGWSELGPWLAP